MREDATKEDLLLEGFEAKLYGNQFSLKDSFGMSEGDKTIEGLGIIDEKHQDEGQKYKDERTKK
jgi:hypothetical protein